MNSKFANVTKNQIETLILPFVPKTKRGFPPKVDLADIVQCILYKLKTGVQWSNLFIDISPPFCWQLVYYYYRKWCRAGVFEAMFEVYLSIQKDKLDIENLNFYGTHSYVKKSCESAGYQQGMQAKMHCAEHKGKQTKQKEC